MDRKRTRVDARESDARRPPSPHHDRPPSKQPRREDRELPASLRGRIGMPNQSPQEQQGSRGRAWEQQQQQHRDSRPAAERQQLGSGGRSLNSQPAGREGASSRDPRQAHRDSHGRDTNGRDSKLNNAQPPHSRDGSAHRSSSAPRNPTPVGAFREPEINRQRASQYDMSSSKARPRPNAYDMSSSQPRAGGRPVSAQQQRPHSARGPPPPQHSSRPAGHFPDSRQRPQQQQQQPQHGVRQPHDSRALSGDRGRPAQPPSQLRGSSSMQHRLGDRGRPASRDSRDSSRAKERSAEQRGAPRREERRAEPSSSNREKNEAARGHTPKAAAAADMSVQSQCSPQLKLSHQTDVQPDSQQQQQQQQPGQTEQAFQQPTGESDQQQLESPNGSQQQSQEHDTAAAAAATDVAREADANEAAADAAANTDADAAGAAASNGKRRPIEFNLPSTLAPPIGELKPRVSSKYSLPQLGQQQQATAEQQHQQLQLGKQQQAGQAAGRSSGDGGAFGPAGFWRDVGPQVGRSRRPSEAASHNEQEHGSGAAAPRHSSDRTRKGEADYSGERHVREVAGNGSEGREQQQQQGRGSEGGHRRSSSGVAASSGRSRSRSLSRSRSMRSYSREHSMRSGSREPADDRHEKASTPARSDQQQQQQPSSSLRGSQPALSDGEAAGSQEPPQLQEVSEDHGVPADHVEMQQLGSGDAAKPSRRHCSTVTPRDALAAGAAAAGAAAAAAPGIARMRSLTPTATTLDATHSSSVAALRHPTQQITLPLQPASPMSAPQLSGAAAFAASRSAEAEQKVASLRARRQGMVALQLRGLPISRHMAYKETFARACKAGRLRPELVDGPLAAARRRAAAAQALQPRFGASLLSPEDPAVPLAVPGRGEEAHIQQLQQVIDVMAVQEAAPYCVQLPDGGGMLLPGALRGLLW